MTAIVDQPAFSGSDSQAAFVKARNTGATMVRLVLNWKDVAPKDPGPDFDARNPNDPGYDWSNFDGQVTEAVSHGLQPIVDVFDAPTWASASGTAIGRFKPNPTKLGEFAHAAALRYSGHYHGLPRARFWQLWDEPNLAWLLRPQYVGKKLESPSIYRAMLNSFADAVHGIHSSNSVIAGGTAPFTSRAGAPSSWGPGPLLFMRDLLCLSKELRPTCNDPVKFDIWSHHPYTDGGPNHHAAIADDVSLGDLPRMNAVLQAAIRLHHVDSKQKVRFWVDEFSWDTNPPDPRAVPIALQTRWVSEALYTMWKAGVSLVTWFMLDDHPLATSPYQSGLYFVDGKPKPSLTAFRFPFVAIKQAGGVYVWGRTPAGKSGVVMIEQRAGGRWSRREVVTTNAYGLFTATVSAAGAGPFRAQLEGSSSDTSEPYGLIEPPDRDVRPFGEAK